MLDRSLLIAPLVAFVIGRVFIVAIRRIAPTVGFVDQPDQRRKLQVSAIPLGGGLAVWLATWLGWGLSLYALPSGTPWAGNEPLVFAALAAASLTLLAVGVIDDRFGLRGHQKLAGQLLAAAILVGLGIRVESLGAFGLHLELGILAYPLTVFWVVLVINAYNLIDGMDGFCGGLSLVAALAIAFLSCWSGRVVDAFLGLAIAGALAAFLKDNLPPAKIYLGDAGSMTLGLLISALSIRACGDGPSTAVSFPALLALVTLPLLDVATAIVRRWLTGRSLFTPDRGHIHHRLRACHGSLIAALGIGVGLATLGCCGSILARVWGMGDGVAALASLTSVGLLVATDTFGGSELRLLLYRLKAALARFLAGGALGQGAIRHECRLTGARDWAIVWNTLILRAEAAGVRRIELAIDMPAAGETYHGLWSLPMAPEGPPTWSVIHSLQVGNMHAGTLRVSGSIDASRDRYLDTVEELVRILEDQLATDIAPPKSVQIQVESEVDPRRSTSGGSLGAGLQPLRNGQSTLPGIVQHTS
jgi:UDP-GlcNAc:undecaprenyl-phosphate/decaprenyl-phosphate GlcNAc-1-phosphate transferase